MYKRNPTTLGTLYLTTVLPLSQSETLKLYSKVWPKFRENVWYGYVPKKALFFDDFLIVTQKCAITYFQKKKYNRHPDSISEYDRGEDWDLEFFAKLVWLTHDYLTNGGFDNPIGVHYNPRLECNVIHPGGSRNQIINLFGGQDVDVLYFNTGGHQPPWLENMEIVDVEDLVKQRGWAAGAVADHGTLIPHFAKETQQIQEGTKKFQRRIYELLSPGMLRIDSNVELTFLDHWIVENHCDYDVKVKFNREPTEKEQLKVTLAILAGVNYKDKYYSVTWKKIKN